MTLISGFYPVLPVSKEISGKIIVQHLGSKMLISSNWASKLVVIGALQRGRWMEAVPTVPCHQAASCPMCLCFFPRKLVKAISGEAKTVKSVHGRSWTSFLTGDVHRAWLCKPVKARAAAGAQIPRARDHFADFLHCLASSSLFFSLGI